MKLRRKLLLAEVPLIVVVAALGLYAARFIGALGGEAEKILQDNDRSIVACERMRGALARVATLHLDPRRPPDVAARIDEAFRAFEAELVAQERNITEEGEDVATLEVRAGFTAWRGASDALGAAPDALRFYETVAPAADRVLRAIDVVLRLNREAMVAKSARTNRLAAELVWNIKVLGVGAVVLVVLLAIVLSDRTTRPLVRLAEAARRIGEGDLDQKLEPAPGNDEVATLVRELDRMTQRLQLYRKSSLGELLEAQEAAQAAIDSLPDPVLSFNAEGGLRRANHAARTVLGVAPDATNPLASVPGEVRAALESARDHVLQGKGPLIPKALEGSLPVIVEGVPRSLQPQALPVYADASGAIVGATVHLRDVTALRRANELKNDLVSAVAHELRTPLTSMRMGLHLCIEEAVGPLTEKQKDLLHAAREDAERLHRLVESILSVSRIESGSLVARRRPATPRELVDAALAAFRVAAGDKGIALTAEAPEEPLLVVDPDSVVLVLSNLASNAVKHTPEGGRIEITARPTPTAVRFAVRDTGPGIALEHQALIFEKFYRVPGSPPGGTGLGLSIARDVVLAHDGEIGLESSPGKGSTFWFELPREANPAASRGAATSAEG